MLKVLLGVGVLTFGALLWVGSGEASRRTATAEIEIAGVGYRASSYVVIAAGYDIEYSFVAGQERYHATTFRTWGLETIRDAKVCFDPADPHNQVLIKGSQTCPR